MPTFETPEPITVTVELGVGDLRIAASDRSDTVVEVRPSDPANEGDVAAAEQTRVEYAGGQLLVKAPKKLGPWKGRESIDVEIALPTGSGVAGEAAVAALRLTGRLGEVRYKTGVGEIHVDQAGPVDLRTSGGDIVVGRVTGKAEVSTGSGALRVAGVDGPAIAKNSNGDTWIGEVSGDLRANAANGKINVDSAHASVVAKSANGDISLGNTTHGEIVAETGLGKVDIGVGDGVAAWLELKTGYGRVQNELESTGQPAPGEAAVEVRAKTGYGDITIHRSSGNQPARNS